MKRWLPWAYLLTAVAAACGSTITMPLDGGSTDGPPSPPGSDGGGTPGTDGGSGPRTCPSALPSAMGACSPTGLVCSYGDDPRLGCRPTASCTNAMWTVSQPCQPAPMPASCPASREAAQANPCSPDQAICNYGGLGCTCTNCSGGPAPHCGGPTLWHCTDPNMMPGCPGAPPNFGDPCAMDGADCNYGCGTANRLCSGGMWIPGHNNPCPISTRTMKQNIEYLSDPELEKLAYDLLAIRLARYQYRDPTDLGKSHLGFIIEDNGPIPAIDPSRQYVDLYGYTSMAVAAIEVQARRIEALERRIRELEAQITPPTMCVSQEPAVHPAR